MTTPSPALSILAQHGQATETHMSRFLDRQTAAPPKLIEAMRYSLLAGGKRLRPTLVLESARATGREINASALSAAAAIELIHTFSLIHDDLPAMDNDDLRRGRPTNHKVFGEAMAILAGDAMNTIAFEMIAVEADPIVAPRLVVELAQATGVGGMIGGQVLDMEGEGKSLAMDQLRRLHRMKTGALLRASCRLGAIAAGAPQSHLSALTAYGEHLGLAFQIVDDILDVTATPEQMGKATGKDAAKGKNTYPTLLGLDESRKQAKGQLQAALDALAPLGTPAEGLKHLAKFVVERDF